MKRFSFVFVAPYVAWMLLLFVLPQNAFSYAVRTVVAAAILAVGAFLARSPSFDADVFRPPLKSQLALGAAGGVFVFILWVAPEFIDAYRNFSLLGFVGLAPTVDQLASSPYDPQVCGWTLTLVRLFGSAFVIAAAEELFFRGFLYRWLQNSDWTKANPRKFDMSSFAWVVGIFALEHHTRLLVGALAGAIYGWIAIRRGIGSAIAAHVVTNFILGVYVIATKSWGFW